MMLREVIYRSSRRNRRGVQPHRINYPSTIMLKCRWLEDALEQGLGSLILDSLDDSIPWDQKLKRAGYTTMTSGVLYTLMRSLPGLGALLQQAYLTCILKKTLSNNVVSSQVKITQVGHIGVQSSVCIDAALAGQMLIPIPILGAVEGSAILRNPITNRFWIGWPRYRSSSSRWLKGSAKWNPSREYLAKNKNICSSECYLGWAHFQMGMIFNFKL